MIRMLTYVKLQGENVKEALDALRDLSVDMPEVCVMDKALYSEMKDRYTIERGGFIYDSQEAMMNLDEGILTLFRGTDRVGHLKCDKVISKKGHKLGNYDFFFDWHKNPTKKQLSDLEKQIDKVLKPLKMKYTITNEEEPLTDVG